MSESGLEKSITAYCEPLSLRAGEAVQLMASSHRPQSVKLDLVRVICGDPTRTGPGFEEIEIDTALPGSIELHDQLLVSGSYGEVDLSGIELTRHLRIDIYVRPSSPDLVQTIFSIEADSGVSIDLQVQRQRFVSMLDGNAIELSPLSVKPARWYRVTLDIDLTGNGQFKAEITPLATRSPGRDLLESSPVTMSAMATVVNFGPLRRCLFAANSGGARFDGRIARPVIRIDDLELQWDFAEDISGRCLVEQSDSQRHGVVHQLPARAVTGPDWNGDHQAWTTQPTHYDAIHFHSDDLYDAQWEVSAEMKLAQDLPSGIYAFRLRTGDEVDRVPFFVRPAHGADTSNIAMLMPSCTYMAYANHRMLLDGADFVTARSRLRPEHEYLRNHPQVGSSMYEKHSDGSGVMYSSRRRPILQLRPGADGWNFTPDTDINAFLAHLDVGHDVIADEDLHHDGVVALAPYKVIVTGSHPEYWSTAMLDALEQWQRDGGRLLYLGGNGFYWRVAFSDEWPGAIELRRAEDGVRNWQPEPGESYHSFNGEYGGLWRRLGRAPNELVGVGFVAQGFERAIGYRRSEASYESRAQWIFAGVDGDHIGTSGLGGGAAGQEVDSYNPALGSPAHAVIVASATEFGPDMSRTKEEIDASILVPSPDPVVRSDIVFYETPAGGAVFSVGSISWFGALAREEYRNDVATITENVIRRFLDPDPFPLPAGDDEE